MERILLRNTLSASSLVPRLILRDSCHTGGIVAFHTFITPRLCHITILLDFFTLDTQRLLSYFLHHSFLLQSIHHILYNIFHCIEYVTFYTQMDIFISAAPYLLSCFDTSQNLPHSILQDCCHIFHYTEFISFNIPWILSYSLLLSHFPNLLHPN